MGTVTLELPDKLYEGVTRSAEDSRQPLSEWIAGRLRTVVPARKPVLTSEEYAAARASTAPLRGRQHRRPALC